MEVVKYLNSGELCEVLNIHRNQLQRMIKQGIPHIRIGREYRFNLNDVLAWLKEQNERS
jgi:excisionase family DNA binding protein